MKLLLLGATGLVGSCALRLALADGRVSEVIAPTRRPLTPCSRLLNLVGERLEAFVPDVMACQPHAVLCTLGTTSAKAGSRSAFRSVDHDLPVAWAKAAFAAGVNTFAVVTAMGASPNSMSFYYRTKGELERELQAIGFRSLIICRPSLIGGERVEARPAERAAQALLRFLAPVLPKQLRVNEADRIAAALLHSVLKPVTGTHRIYSSDMP